ncbi:hypothetical protein AKJ16_DCAP07641, partial [Drosera capensis]
PPSTFFIVQWTIEDFSTVDSLQLKAGLRDAAAILSLGPIVLVGVAGMVQGKRVLRHQSILLREGYELKPKCASSFTL